MANINKSWFFEKIKLINLKSDSRKKKRRSESINLEIKKNKLQLTLKTYPGSYGTGKSNCMPIKWKTWKKWTNSLKGTTFQD